MEMFVLAIIVFIAAHIGSPSSGISRFPEKLTKELYVNLITDAFETRWKAFGASTENLRTMHNVAIPGLILTKPTIVARGGLEVLGVPVVHLRDDRSVEIKFLAFLGGRKVKYNYSTNGGASGKLIVTNGDRKYKMFFKSDEKCAVHLMSMVLVEEEPIALEAEGPSSAEVMELSKAIQHWLTLESRASAYHSIDDSMSGVHFHTLDECTDDRYL